MTPIEIAKNIRAKLNIITNDMTDEQAVENVILFNQWNGNGINYKVGDRVVFNNTLYKVLQNHTSQINWNPELAVSLFAEVLIPDPDVIPEWKQPDSTNPYMKDDKVKHNDLTWQSDVDNNVWEPGVYGWIQINE